MQSKRIYFYKQSFFPLLSVLSTDFDKELTAITSGVSEPNWLIREARKVETLVEFGLQPEVLAVVVDNSHPGPLVLDRAHLDHISVVLVVLDAHNIVKDGSLPAKPEVTRLLVEIDDLEDASASFILLLITDQSWFSFLPFLRLPFLPLLSSLLLPLESRVLSQPNNEHVRVKAQVDPAVEVRPALIAYQVALGLSWIDSVVGRAVDVK